MKTAKYKDTYNKNLSAKMLLLTAPLLVDYKITNNYSCGAFLQIKVSCLPTAFVAAEKLRDSPQSS